VTAASAPAQPTATAPSDPIVGWVRGTGALLCVIGAGLMAWAYYRAPVVFPAATVLAVVLELPLLFLGWWLLRLARPLSAPPRTWSAAAVIWGATAATGCALQANEGLTGLWAKAAGVGFASNWSAALTAPLNEELLKAAGVALIVLAAPRAIRGPLDGLIYGALVGLGFQVMENVTYSLNFIPLTGATNPGAAVALSAVLRVGLTALGSHWAMTAVAGAGVGYLAARGLRRGAPRAAACLATAMTMHLLFDAPGPGPLILLKVLLNFVVVLALYVALQRGYRARARAALARRVAAGAVPAVEAPTLLPRRRRRRRQRAVPVGPVRDQVRSRQLADLADIEQEAASG
jgi:RsiW-degrading membrane proteinase PrsW (M82 family)